MTNDDLDRLIELAKKATPGPWGWTYDGSSDYSVGRADDPQAFPRVATIYDRSERDGANAIYIAAVSPDVVIRLCEELKRWRENQRTAEGDRPK